MSANPILDLFRVDQASAGAWAASLEPEYLKATFGDVDWSEKDVADARAVLLHWQAVSA